MSLFFCLILQDCKHFFIVKFKKIEYDNFNVISKWQLLGRNRESAEAGENAGGPGEPKKNRDRTQKKKKDVRS